MINGELNIKQLEQLIADGFVMKNKHPNLSLWIYNYTQSAQYNRVWNETTVQCRGLILNADYEVIARPFSKFFNIEEEESANLPNLPFEIHEKMDGSLGVLYWIDDQPFISTRNSFTSDQSIKANQLLQSTYKKTLPLLDKNKTYVFEIIYPQNRIVVDYGKKESLTLLAVIDTKTGIEETLPNIGFPLPKNYAEGTSFADLKKLNWANKEGFVIKYSNGFRVKIKFENYIELHHMVTQISSFTIWEQLKEGKHLTEWLENVPDEFYNWVRKVEKSLLEAYKKIEKNALEEYTEFPTKKETALYFKTCKNRAVLFAMYNKKSYAQMIWKKIKPAFEKAHSY